MSRLPLQRSGYSPLRRLYRISVFSALLMSAPALFLCGWYVSGAVVDHFSYNRVTGTAVQLSPELFHLHLFDRLSRDWRRVKSPRPDDNPEMPVINLHLNNVALDRLAGNLPPGEGKGEYVRGFLEADNRFHPMRTRYRGRRHWHWHYPQKSWKVRLDEGHFYHGQAVFGLLNTVTSLPYSEQLVLDIARERDLLAPEYHPVRLLLNNALLGVYFLSTQPGEGLLRNNRRIPGGIYSGSGAPINPQTGISSLWESAEHWKKVATSQTDKLKDKSRLEVLLQAIHGADAREFSEFARRHLDVQRFALFDALDVVFGGNKHDYHQDHKLYFDPYRGRFEPISWHFRNWSNPGRLNRTENPLLLRLKDLPEYLTIRNRLVYDLIYTECSSVRIRERAEQLFSELAREQLSDPFWDAYRLVPNLSAYYDEMVRPMTRERQEVVLDSELASMGRRIGYLTAELGRWGLSGQAHMGHFELVVDGNSGYRLEAVDFPGCDADAVGFSADSEGNGQLDLDSDRAAVGGDTVLYPGNRLIERKLHPHRGKVRAEPSARRYRYRITGDCRPTEVRVSATHLVSGVTETINLKVEEGILPAFEWTCDASYAVEPGHESIHPWCLPVPVSKEVVLGPGKVKVARTRSFGPETTVRILPGTRFVLGKKVSLIFRGKVLAKGTAEDPIRFKAKKGKRWGAVALIGPGTEGSRLEHITLTGGSKGVDGLSPLPGMLNIHDTRDIKLQHVVLRGHRKGEDALHAAYVKKLRLSECSIFDSSHDALDLEFSKAVLDNLTIVGAGEEGVDVMGGKVTVRNAAIIGCGENAVSAGEESRVALVDSVLAHGNCGVLAKNASRVRIEGSLLYRLQTGVEVHRYSDRYDGRARVKSDLLHVVECEVNAVAEKGGLEKVVALDESWPPADLEELESRVLKISHWDDFDYALERLRGAVQ